MNNKGPNIEPCGTPYKIFRVFDLSEFTVTNCFLLVK